MTQSTLARDKTAVKIEKSGFRFNGFLHSPVWYVVMITALTVLTVQLGLLWWLAGVVALIWGIWLVWQQFGPNAEQAQSEDEGLQRYLNQALVYKTQIDQALKAAVHRNDKAHQVQLAIQIESWARAIENLTRRIESLRQDALIDRDLVVVPQAVVDLQTQLDHETDPTVRAELERALTSRQNQQASLELLQNTIRRAEIQIENTLSLLGTVYSQILTSQSSNHVADYSRLAVEVDEEVKRLQDHLEALWEVKGGL